MKKNHILDFLHTITLVVVLVSAWVSLRFMFKAGHSQKSVLLIALFTGWVISPFIALFVANVVSKRWSVLTRVTLYIFTIVLALSSLLSYSGAWTPPGTKPAFLFLVVPFISWLLMSILILILKRKENS